MSAPQPPMPSSVVIVDDESDHSFIIRHLLRDLLPGLPVSLANDADTMAAALDAAPSGTLVLADRLLHGRDSLQLLAPLLAPRPDVCFALLSAAISEHDRARALDAGAIEAAQKPGSLDEWRSLLTRLVELAGSDGRGQGA